MTVKVRDLRFLGSTPDEANQRLSNIPVYGLVNMGTKYPFPKRKAANGRGTSLPILDL